MRSRSAILDCRERGVEAVDAPEGKSARRRAPRVSVSATAGRMERSGMGRARASGGKYIAWRNWSQRNWRRIGLTAFLVLSFGFGFYLAELYGQISTLIEQRSAGLTSAI